MVKIHSKDYHDYVIKNGKLIGEFEQMYQNAKDVPWHQDKQNNCIDIKITTELLNKYSPFDSIIDIGSGLGYFLSILSNELGSPNCNVLGLDVSETCCKKARKIFPKFSFFQYDVMKKNRLFLPEIRKKKRLFSLRGTLWYVFPKMKIVVENIANITNENDYFLISQNFPPLSSSFVGKEIIPNQDAFKNWFLKDFDILESVWIENYLSSGNDNWFIAIFKRKKDIKN